MIKLHRSKNKQHYFTVNASNGQVLVTSETYKTKQALEKGIGALKAAILRTILKEEFIVSHSEEDPGTSREL